MSRWPQRMFEERFWDKVAWSSDHWAEPHPVSACWEWLGARSDAGYGQIRADKPDWTVMYAHRLAYELERDEIPHGLHIDHLCKNRRCCNPWHLEPVTLAENNKRAHAGATRSEVTKAKMRTAWTYRKLVADDR